MTYIGIAGKAESGKDTAAGFITTVYPRTFYRRAFADALKRDALRKWLVDPLVTRDWPEERVLAMANELKNAVPEFRTLLQTYGVAAREADPDYWIHRLMHDHGASPHFGLRSVVVPDVRFRNEAEFILDQGGLVIRLERPRHENRLTPEQRAHISETDLDDFPAGERYGGEYVVVVNPDEPVLLLQRILAAVDHHMRWRR